ncbi:unnamed protein product [Prunus armeniaca]
MDFPYNLPLLLGKQIKVLKVHYRKIKFASWEVFGLVFEPFECSLELRIYRSPGGTIEAEKTCVVELDQGKWVVKSAFGIVKHGGVTPINPGWSAHLMSNHVLQAIIAQTCASRHFVSLNETTASGLPTRHRAREHTVRQLQSSNAQTLPNHFINPSTLLKPQISALHLVELFTPFSECSVPSILTYSDGPPVAFPKPRLSHIRRSSHRGLIQMVFPLLLSTNYPSSWKVDVGQGHGVAKILSGPWGRMTFLLMRLWRNCNAIDEDGRAWYDDYNLATSVWLSTSVAPMVGVTVLASPSHSCAQNDGPGHDRSDGPDCNPVSPMPRVTASPMVRMTALTLAGYTRVLSDGLGHGLGDGLGLNPVSPMSRVTA